MAVGNNLFFVFSSAAHPPDGCLISCQCRKQTAFTHLTTTAAVQGGSCIPPWAIRASPLVVKALSITEAGSGMAREAKAGAIGCSEGYKECRCSSPQPPGVRPPASPPAISQSWAVSTAAFPLAQPWEKGWDLLTRSSPSSHHVEMGKKNPAPLLSWPGWEIEAVFTFHCL